MSVLSRQASLASTWQFPGVSNGSMAQAASMAEPMGRAASLGRTGSLQALGAQPRSFLVTTGDVVVRSSSSAFDQTEAACQVHSACHLVLWQHLSSARPRVFSCGMSSGIWPSMCCNGKCGENACLRFGSASNQVQKVLEAKCRLVCVLLQSPLSSASMQQLPTPFLRQGSGATEQTMGPAPPAAAGATPRRDDGSGAFSRAASVPAAALARSASGTHDDTLRLGEASHFHVCPWDLCAV